MEEYEVDLAVSGHVHAYARTCNVYKEECIGNDDGGTTHVTLGATSPFKYHRPMGSSYPSPPCAELVFPVVIFIPSPTECCVPL